MSLEYKGYAIHDQAKWDQFSVIDFKPKTFGEYDCEIAIEVSGENGLENRELRKKVKGLRRVRK